MAEPKYKTVQIEDFQQFVGAEVVERIRQKARLVQNIHVVNVNSTYYGGGVAQLLSSLTLLLNSMGIKTGWRVLNNMGSADCSVGPSKARKQRSCKMVALSKPIASPSLSTNKAYSSWLSGKGHKYSIVVSNLSAGFE